MKRATIFLLALALALTATAATANGSYKYCQTVYIYQQPGTGFRPPVGPIAGIPVRFSIYYGAPGCGGGGQLVCRSDFNRTDAHGRVRVCCQSDVDVGNSPLPSAWCIESSECRSPWWRAGGAGGICYLDPGFLPWAGNVHFGVGGSRGQCNRTCEEGVLDPARCVCVTPTPASTPASPPVPTPTSAPGATSTPTPPTGGTVEPPPRVETPEPPQPTVPVPPPTPHPYNPPPAHPVVIHFGVDVDHPVVVEQDPDRRGADIFLELRVPAVVYDYEVEYAPGQWAPARQVVTDYAVLQPGRYRFQANLTPQSRAWIRGELAARYPNARIVRPNWDLTRSDRFRITDNTVDTWGRHTVRMQAVEVPFVDPGVYRVVGRFVTTGTRFTPPAKPYRNVRANGAPGTSTPPRVLMGTRNLRVWMLDSFLIE